MSTATDATNPEARQCLVSGVPLAYSLFGAGPRKAIFFHGHPGSRVQGAFLNEDARRLGLEVAAFDRAGFGRSGLFRHEGSPLDLSGALLALARDLGWKRFHLIAVSGGAPYALCSAPALGRRVLSIQLVCGLGPLAERRFRRKFPWGPLHAMRLGAWLPETVFSGIAYAALRGLGNRGGSRPRPRFLSPADFELLQSPGIRPLLRLSLESAFRQGARGAQRDLKAFLTPWKLDYGAISAPVRLWHGNEDRLVPWEFSAWLAERIPGSELHLVEGEGHYTLPLRKMREILEKIP